MPTEQEPQYLAGALWMIASGFLFVAVYVLVRFVGSEMSAVQTSFIRYCFGLLFVVPIFLRMKRRVFTGELLKTYFFRGVVHGAAVMLWFYAMARIPIAEVTAIGYTTPIYTALGAILIFKEKVHFRRIMAIIVGFVGTLIILRPGMMEIQIGAVAQLFAALFFAISFLFAKKLTRTESSTDILAMLTLFCTLVLLPGALIEWQTPTLMELAGLALVAVFATAGHYAITKSISKAPLSAIQPFAFLQLIWAILFGFLIFDEVPDMWVLVGAAIIVAAISYITHRESVVAKRQMRLQAGDLENKHLDPQSRR